MLTSSSNRVEIIPTETGSYNVNLQVIEETDIVVYLKTPNTLQYTLVEDTDYSLSMSGSVVTNITFPLAGSDYEDNYTSGNLLVILRLVDETQETDYTGLSEVYLPAVESDQDRLVMMVQQHSEKLDRAVLYDETYTGSIASGESIDATAFRYFDAINSIDEGVWAYVATIDQYLSTTSDVEFNSVTIPTLDISSNTNKAATTAFVHNVLKGLAWKQSVDMMATDNITLSGEQTLDGQLSSGSRVLAPFQTDATENGIYDTSSASWTRATDADSTTELTGATVYVEAGSDYAKTWWTQTTQDPVIGTDDIVWGMTGAGGGNVEIEVSTESAHGFSVGQPVGIDNSGSWFLCNSSTEDGARFAGIVSSVGGDYTFFLTPNGPIELTVDQWDAVTGQSGGLTVGQYYVISDDTSGSLVVNSDFVQVNGHFYAKVLYALSSIRANIMNFDFELIGSIANIAGESFDADDLSSTGVLTFVHNLGTQYPVIWMYNEDGSPIEPADITPTSGSTTLSSDITLDADLITELGSSSWYIKALG